jgi:hypothetical protein
MAQERGSLSREEFAQAVRDGVNSGLSDCDHHPHDGYTPAAFRHYVRRLALLRPLESVGRRAT